MGNACSVNDGFIYDCFAQWIDYKFNNDALKVFFFFLIINSLMGLAVIGTNSFYYNMLLLQLTNMKMEWGDFTKLGACEPVIYDQLLKLW